MIKIRGQKVIDPKERLARLSRENTKTGCIEWIGSTRNGYGRLMVGSRSAVRKSMSAHRYAYEIYVGSIPDGMYVCHKCDNKSCINHEHLFLGTHQDNIDDRQAKGRNKPRQNLTPEQVIEIRNKKNVMTSKELAAQFDVTYWTIKEIWRGRYHKNLLPAPPQAGEEG